MQKRLVNRGDIILLEEVDMDKEDNKFWARITILLLVTAALIFAASYLYGSMHGIN